MFSVGLFTIEYVELPNILDLSVKHQNILNESDVTHVEGHVFLTSTYDLSNTGSPLQRLKSFPLVVPIKIRR